MGEQLQYGPYLIDEKYIVTKDQETLSLIRIINNQNKIQSTEVNHIVKQPLICLHGSYCNRFFWLSPKGIGLAGHLFDAGFDIWIAEFRGRGASEHSPNVRSFTLDDMAKFDMPAIQKTVQQTTQRPAMYLCHSMGGNTLLASLVDNNIEHEQVKGMVLLGCQATEGQIFLKNPLIFNSIKLLLKIVGYFPAKKLNYGPEDESAQFMLQAMQRRRLGKWINAQGEDRMPLLENIDIPTLCVTSEGDTQDPKAGVQRVFKHLGSTHKKLVCLGKAHANLEDYSHVDMVVSKSAAKEIWPMIEKWFKGAQ